MPDHGASHEAPCPGILIKYGTTLNPLYYHVFHQGGKRYFESHGFLTANERNEIERTRPNDEGRMLALLHKLMGKNGAFPCLVNALAENYLEELGEELGKIAAEAAEVER